MSPSRVDSPIGSSPFSSFDSIPPFPTTIPTAPLLRISLSKLLSHDADEEQRLWNACRDLGFFYLDLRNASSTSTSTSFSPTTTTTPTPSQQHTISGDTLLHNADALFSLQKQLFDLPLPEKQRYDWSSKGSYFGYKGYGAGVIDKKGTADRNEFYNVSKDDVLDVVAPQDRLPAPEMLGLESTNRKTLASFIEGSHAVVRLILDLLDQRLGLPWGKLGGLHRLEGVSGDQ
ncbi:hypothetical protein LTS18_013538, partial [Coniosporium uncinatum]